VPRIFILQGEAYNAEVREGEEASEEEGRESTGLRHRLV
jgi:hypothetical protein